MGWLKKLVRKTLPPINPFDTNNPDKIFCVSMQRTGTTSVGNFFKDFGFKWAGWPADHRDDWTRSWYDGNFAKIFSSLEFRATNAYEDSPWFLPGFYEVLFEHFPRAKFVLFTRDADAWFESMRKHSKGNVVGRSRIHARIYGREEEFFRLLESGAIDEAREDKNRYEKTMKILPGHAGLYKAVYERHNDAVRDFFAARAPQLLHVGSLEDPLKWKRLGAFLGVEVPDAYQSHENQSR